jgi:hypothetical protein
MEPLLNPQQYNLNKTNDDFHSRKFVIECNREETIKIIDPKYESKIKTFKDNPDNLMIVTDFDFTLTKNYIESERLLSCINVMILRCPMKNSNDFSCCLGTVMIVKYKIRIFLKFSIIIYTLIKCFSSINRF